MADILHTDVQFVSGVGPQRADLLKTELGIHTIQDLISHLPIRYEDRSKVYKIRDIKPDMSHIQVVGTIVDMKKVGSGYKKRLSVKISDGTGYLELVWFKGFSWFEKSLRINATYVVFGKPNVFGKNINIAHPEIEAYDASQQGFQILQPIYPVTEKLRKKYVSPKVILKFLRSALKEAYPQIKETLPASIRAQYKLMDRRDAYWKIHLPETQEELIHATYRLKFEEVFFVLLNLHLVKAKRFEANPAEALRTVDLLTQFYNDILPFELTNAQKRVIKEVRSDMGKPRQMNRLVQGDVGSGKTIVAFMAALIAISNQGQAALMAPTEILAEQHFNSLRPFATKLGIPIALLTGSTKKAHRDQVLESLRMGTLYLVVGTHALIEESVKFHNLYLTVIDEQHRFGVAQRAKLWQKDSGLYPHVLVMTATPIPRTLAMTFYGDLDYSVIDELPPGRKPIKTFHYRESFRLKLNGFINEQLKQGAQVYFVYPLIEESEKLDLHNLDVGYENVRKAFPDYQVSIVHGRMKAEDKDFEMQRFVRGETQVMVATTVIEVGVDVPNASIMVIESAERFGLAQLHQLRGRVGRGSAQSYCILMSGQKLTQTAKQRLETMVKTNNGFEIAEMDLKLRGPGDIMGTQQSGIGITFTNLARDGKIVSLAREAVNQVLQEDPHLDQPENYVLKTYLKNTMKNNWIKAS